MENQGQNKVIPSKTSIVLLIALLLLCTCSGIQRWKSSSKEQSLRAQIILSDSLKKVAEGQYNKVVNDLHSQSELNSILKSENADLYKQLRDAQKSPVAYIGTDMTFTPKSNPVTPPVTTSPNWTFEDFYPDPNNPFVTYTLSVNGDDAKSKWDFGKIKLDLVISETKAGIFEADFKAPEFVILNSLDVHTLPLTPAADPNNFDWLLGGGGLYNPTTTNVKFLLSGGVRYKTNNFILQSTGDYHGFSYLKAF